jgi:glycosyltransferase involved in cell wall biosynthesis
MSEMLRVLQSFPVPRPTTNPYLVMLDRSLRRLPGTDVLTFSWRRALLAKYDVLHVHWPEILVNGATPVKKMARQLLTVALMIRLQTTRTPLVRTVHNIYPPEGISRRERLILDLMDRSTTLRIRLNTETELPKDAHFVTIRHGDYRDWFSTYSHQSPVPGQLCYVGLIRRYKGVEGLIAAFRQTENLMDGLTLRLAGNPSSADLRNTIVGLSKADPRIKAKLSFIPDRELVEIVTSSELVVLPYRFMHNSGGVLMALSLGRPVLVPGNRVNAELQREVGPGWVHTFDGQLEPEDIIRTLKEIRDVGAPAAPSFKNREWHEAAEKHLLAYRQAVSIRRGRSA